MFAAHLEIRTAKVTSVTRREGLMNVDDGGLLPKHKASYFYWEKVALGGVGHGGGPSDSRDIISGQPSEKYASRNDSRSFIFRI